MITYHHGNILEAPVEAVVNTVNCVGVMGKGLALLVKQTWPDVFAEYAAAAKRGDIVPGQMHVVRRSTLEKPRFVVNFPTKRHWRAPSSLEDVESGLRDLVWLVREMELPSIAVPALGCGNGGLDWTIVRACIEEAFASMPEVDVWVYPPAAESGSRLSSDVLTQRIVSSAVDSTSVTRIAWQALGRLLREYQLQTGTVTVLEGQKLAWFLQFFGVPLGLHFEKGAFGPFAEELPRLLAEWGESIVSGEVRSSPLSVIAIRPLPATEDECSPDPSPAYVSEVNHVLALSDGFADTYGMELLATVHWVGAQLATGSVGESQIMEGIHGWSERKRTTMQPPHIRAAMWQLAALDAWSPLSTTEIQASLSASPGRSE
jgi:O-acetyl-ADP-ribose deacetylase (regulator of RNase III)